MFILKKIISIFLLPPGLFILVQLVAGWLLIRVKRRGLAAFCMLTGVSLWLLSMPAIAGLLIDQLERGLTVPKQIKGDVIILLGGGCNDHAIDLTGKGTPSDSMMTRLVTAVRLQRKLGVPIIVSGGIVYSGRSAEAPIARRFLVDLGVPSERILVEEKSRDTIENARFSREIMHQHHFRQPILVTSAFHMRRSIEAFRKAGLKVTPVPAGLSGGKADNTIWGDFLPESWALHESATCLREYLGLLYYWGAGKQAD